MNQVLICEYCGSLKNDGVKCENCGAVLPFDIKPAPPKLVSDTPASPDAFIVRRLKDKSLSGDSFLIGCFVVFFLVISAIIISSYNSYRDYQVLQERGIVREGRVLDKRISTSDESDTYYLRYGYPYQGQAYEREQIVSKGLYNSYRIGASIPIRLDPQNPRVSRIDGTQEEGAFLFILGGLCVALILMSGLSASSVARSVRLYLQRRRFARNHQVVMGEVVKAEGQTHIYNDDGSKEELFYLVLAYRFISPQSGKVIQETATEYRPDLDPDHLPAVGTPIKVAYLDDKNFDVL